MSIPRLRRRELPDATIARLPQYIRCLSQLENAGLQTVHSVDLAAQIGVSGAVVRRDLSYVGSYGKRGVGYPVAELREHVTGALGLAGEHHLVIVGVGHLGRALAGYGGFLERGLRVVGLFDVDPDLVGSKAGNPDVGQLEIQPMSELEAFVAGQRAVIGVIATPGSAAQAVADRLVAAGARSILNFSAVHLDVPPDVVVRPVDLATEIQILAVHAGQREPR
ncbi:MAG: redox-sensing transcriptional repressor Rex [Candidatus Nanopelagicales bacterium]